MLLSGAGAEKHLSVYSTAASYPVTIVQRLGHDYVGLLELLEPLGKVHARTSGDRWRLRYNGVEGEFNAGKNHARVQGRDTDLTAPFILENGRGLVPVAALASLMPRFLGGPVNLREDAGRLFIGGIATHFTAALAGDNPPMLVFHFTSPVNPAISSGAGSLRMSFTREPVVAPAVPTLTFGSKIIPSATYGESNGAAVITVNSASTLSAAISRDGRTVTITPAAAAPAVTAQNAPPAAAPNPASVPTPAQPVPPPPGSPVINRRYFAVVDASHGGDDRGETLSSTLTEKDITVALARSLRHELESRGIPTLLLRDSDANLGLDQRAIFANTSHAAIYIALHVASSGRGVRVYTALLPYGSDDRGPFRSWTTSQHASLMTSQFVAAAVAGELQKRQIPVRMLTAPLRPLNNVTFAALAVEIAPLSSDVSQLTAPDYQQLLTSAIATAVAADRGQLETAP